MNRRNFMVGLGTVATISGVASVTAASFADEFEATADFRVIVDEELTVRLGDAFDDIDTQAELGDEPRFVEEPLSEAGGEEFEELDSDSFDDGEDDDDGTLLYTNVEDEPENDQIELELAVLNDDENNPAPYENLLEVENSGATEQQIGIEYNYGEDVDTDALDEEEYDFTQSGGEVDASTVAELFIFERADDDEQLSPGSDNPEDAGGPVTISPGTDQITLDIDLDPTTAGELAEAADVSDEIFSGAQQDLDLLDEVRIGLIEDDGEEEEG